MTISGDWRQCMRKAARVAGLFITLSSLFAAATLTAQSTKVELSGAVRDTTGLPVAQANVQLINEGTQSELSTTSGADGMYHFVALQPGTYSITVAKAGFASVRRRGVTLRVGDQIAL